MINNNILVMATAVLFALFTVIFCIRLAVLSRRLDILIDAHNKMAEDYGRLIQELIGEPSSTFKEEKKNA